MLIKFAFSKRTITLAYTLTHLTIIRKFEADANFEKDGARLGRDGQRRFSAIGAKKNKINISLNFVRTN